MNDPSQQNNPYYASATPQMQQTAGGVQLLSEAESNKAQAIIKDANQFWLAILMCFLCSGFGVVIIGPWYLVRLLQWQGIAGSHPAMVDPNAPPGSLSDQFRNAKWKLITGFAVGLAMLVVFGALISASIIMSP